MSGKPKGVLISDSVFGARRTAVQIVSGTQQILRLSRSLKEFSLRCGQPDAIQDLAYFLTKPGALPRVPHLLVVGPGDLNSMHPRFHDSLGCLLIFEQQISGIGTRAFATNDRSGRSTLIAKPEDRSKVAAVASRALLERGAHLILMSYRAGEVDASTADVKASLVGVTANGKSVAKWAIRGRSIPGYLPLSISYDATLARMGARTRRNLRYYRRRAEQDLGCGFVPLVQASRAEVLDFGRQCMYPVPPEVVAFRYESLKELEGPLFMGMKDRDGRWLSMLGARRYLNRSEILWQLNREGLEAYSLGTVMRSYFIEHEIAHGSRRLYTEGGTPHSMKFSFVQEDLTDLVVVRKTLVAKAMQMIAQRYVRPDNELSRMLCTANLDWLPC